MPRDQRATQQLPEDADVLLDSFVELLDTQAQVDEAGRIAYRYLSLGHSRGALCERLGHVLLREDAEFHSFQMLESAFNQAEELDEERARIALVGAARYLAAHAPTARALKQTANLALRLHRERIFRLKIRMKRWGRKGIGLFSVGADPCARPSSRHA